MFAGLSSWMAQLPAGTAEFVGVWVAALLTLAVLSYILGDNPIFRLVEYLFVGVAAGYAASLAWNNMLWPRLRLLITEPAAYWHYGIFFILGLLLLARSYRPIAVLGNLPLGLLFGIGAALAIGGALSGSLIPQLRASVTSLNPADYGAGLVGWAYALDALILLVGTIAVLSAFHFTAQGRGLLGSWGNSVLRAFGKAGRGLILVTFGALLAGAILSFFAILNSRIVFLLRDWLGLIGV